MDSTQRRGGMVSLSPSQTPRSSDKSVRELRSADSNSSTKNEKDKGVNVQDELRVHTPVVISCSESRREVSAVQNIANKQIDRTFAFDKVFGPTSQQKELYDQAVSPIVNEVLEGYNCTIFAYGQTGTGKTYTMEGGAWKKNGEFPSDAGVIPRAVKQIFDILEAQNAEYNMKVTFLELYNEEITDLLALEENSKFIDDKSEETNSSHGNGRGGVFVRGLEEEIVCTANEIYKILEKEVYAAREKNGIYVPRDRYLHEEAEKKAMAEKIERMELDSESKDKQLMELQELYNSQQLLTAELSDGLEKTEKKLEETEHALFDLEEKHRQANATIKEKEFLIANLLRSEKALVEQAFELRAELENAASDVSSLFAKIERKDKIEDGNRILIQHFQAQLTQQLEILHKTVAVSVTQQEQQLKGMEEDMQSFVLTKAEATEELQGRLEKLRSMYGSGVKALDDVTGELEVHSQSTFVDLNSEVSKHSSALEDLFKGIASEADALLNDLQSSLHKQEEKLSAFAHQQRQAHARAVETARSVSKITVNFFQTLDTHACKLTQIVEEAQTVNDQKLSELEKKFEECAADEERQLLEKVADLLASSNARKKKLVQVAVSGLRESATSRTNKLQQEMSTMQDSTSSIKAEWTVHMDKTESHYVEDTSTVECGKKDLEEALQNCLKKATLGAKQWKNAQESLLTLEKSNVASVDSIVRRGMEANEVLRAQFSSAMSAALGNVDIANKDLLSSIDYSLQLDHDACGNLNSMIVPCCGDLRELKGGHYHKVVEITENAGKCLLHEYTVDEPSCSTPRRRSFNLPSVTSIEELRTPAFEELVKTFWEAKSAKHANGDAKHIAGAYEAAQPVRDSRVPLTAIN
ncbi:hypothetical protein CJ030_MR1G027815 [Morella rubra]|uniref:Kinesin motor domain-containing protein n=1 Tax=Morella rubra TaxID=262757 RepID=A0A6A1WNM9_9ROSI|nr:hypothetical protein CJ030_MR1G027815 [Morella rubra]